MIKEYISMQPCNAWNQICSECNSLLNSKGFVIKIYSRDNLHTPIETKYLCSSDARLIYPHYFKTEKEKRKELKRKME